MPVIDVAEAVRQAEELRARQALQLAAGDLGRARRYGWPADREAIIAANLAAARARLAAVKNGSGESHIMTQPLGAVIA